MIIYLKCTKCNTIERQKTTPTPSGEDYAVDCNKCGNELERLKLGDGKLFAPSVIGKNNALLYENMLLSIMNKNRITSK